MLIITLINSNVQAGNPGLNVINPSVDTDSTTQNISASAAIVYNLPLLNPQISPALQCTGFPNYFNAPSACGTNGALNFSGSSFGTRNLLYNGTDNVTMEIWAKWDGTISNNNNDQVLFYNGHTGNGGYGILMKPNRTLEILLGGEAYLTGSAKLTAGIWQHVAIVRNLGTWSLYLDGIQYSMSSNTKAPRPPNAVDGNKTSVGSGESNNHKFYGSLDEAKFWTVARSTAQIQSDMKECSATATTGLLAYWDFNDGTGNTAADRSGTGNTLILTNTSWTTSGAPTGATYLWNFGDGSTASTPGAIHVYNTPGQKTVTLTVTDLNGYSSSSTTELTVNQSPTASITGTAVSCATPITLTASGGLSYQWSGGNSPNTATNTFNTSGTYTVTVTNESGCTATASQQVVINALPAVPFNGALPEISVFVSGLFGAGSLAFDPSGNLFVVQNSMVKKITNTGAVSIFTTGIRSQSGLVLDASGNLYVSYNQGVKKIAADGTVSTLVSGINNLNGLTIDESGNLFIISQLGTILKVTSDGTVSTFVDGLNNPKGIAFRSGFLYVSEETNNGAILKITPESVVSRLVTNLSYPKSIAFDGSGKLYIAENNNIKMFSSEGVLSTLLSGLNSVNGIAFNLNGLMHISYLFDQVSKVTFPEANVTSVSTNGSVVLTATPSSGETVDWYDAASGGNMLAFGSNNYTTPSMTATTIFYAESRNVATGCVSSDRTAIMVTASMGSNMFGAKVATNVNVVDQNGKHGGSGLNSSGQIIFYKPTLGTTKTINTIGANSAESGGLITSTGGAAISARGVCWSLSANPTIADNKTVDGNTTSFTSSISGLTSGTIYYVRAYATNVLGTSYGTEVSFTTL